MADSTNSKKNLRLVSRDRYAVQTGTIPAGVTAAGSKYPVNSANVSIDNPNFPAGPTLTPLIPMSFMSSDFKLNLAGDWSGKIKTGDPVEILRGSIKNEYTIQTSVYNIGGSYTGIVLSNQRDVVHLLDSFIGTTGYNTPATDSYISLSRKIESPNDPNFLLVRSFTTKMIADTNPDTFSLSTSWELDPSAKIVRMRWRSVPRNQSVSQLSFTVTVNGNYSQVPQATVVSSSGRRAEIQLTATGTTGNYTVNGVTVVQQGGNYLSAPTVVIDPTYQIGLTAAQVSASLALYNEGRVDYIRVADGGSGYTGASVAITGSLYANDATAVAEIENGEIKNVRLLTSGYGYTASPIVTITPTGTGGTGAVAVGNVDMYSEWVYTDTYQYGVFSDKLSGFKYNVPYEIEILASQDQYFRGLVRYTNLSHFQYYK